jgi:hypothetical protein
MCKAQHCKRRRRRRRRRKGRRRKTRRKRRRFGLTVQTLAGVSEEKNFKDGFFDLELIYLELDLVRFKSINGPDTSSKGDVGSLWHTMAKSSK